MPVTPAEAADSLKAIEKTAYASAVTHRYARAAPHLMLWGCVWIVGYTVTDLAPRFANGLWAILLIGATVTAMLIGRAQQRTAGGGAGDEAERFGWRYAAAMFVFFCFIGAVYAVMRPVSYAAQAAFVPLVIACVYTIMGLWIGWRFVVAGVVLAVVTLGGFFYLPQHFLIWQGISGGGALILAGLWFRTV
jgi:hypothetical protein